MQTLAEQHLDIINTCGGDVRHFAEYQAGREAIAWQEDAVGGRVLLMEDWSVLVVTDDVARAVDSHPPLTEAILMWKPLSFDWCLTAGKATEYASPTPAQDCTHAHPRRTLRSIFRWLLHRGRRNQTQEPQQHATE